jgi:ubiquitin carboxyl-terminal hydrolase L5
LDGLQPGPVSVGTYKMDSTTSTDLSWLDVAREAIQQRIDRYSMGEIKFNLMAVCRDTRLGIQSRINNLIAAGLTDGDEMLEELRVQLMEEEAKRQRWKEENERRRHNYLPLFLEILRAYARCGKLPELTRKAQKMAVDTKLQKMK